MKLAQSGFTLVEVMIVLAVAGVLLALALPGFATTLRNNRLSSQTNEFIYALKFARTEAAKRGIPVTACRSTNQTTCSAGTAGWETGWIVFAENAGNVGVLDTAAATYASGSTLAAPIVRTDGRVFPTGSVLTASTTTLADVILVRHEALTGGSTLDGDNNVTNRITFNSQGMAQAGLGSFVLCDSRGNAAPPYNGSVTSVPARASAREIIVSFSGQTRLTTPTSRAATSPVTSDPATCTPP